MPTYKRALMCAPYYYDIPAVENPHMTGKQPIDKELALREWTDLVNILQRLGLVVHFVPPVAERWDMVFAANGGWAHGDRVLLSNFRLPIRQGEKKHFQNALVRMGFSLESGDLRRLPDEVTWEGQGDVLEGSKGMIFHGWGFRSDRDAFPYVRDLLLREEQLVELHLVNPDFYHEDTCLLPIPSRDALVFYPKAFHFDSVKKLQGMGLDSIEISPLLAYCFVANSIVLGDTVLLNVPFAPTDECRELSARGVFFAGRSDPRFLQLHAIDTGGLSQDNAVYRKVRTARSTSFVNNDAGYVWLVQELLDRKLNVVPVYTSQFMPSGAGARCCVMLLE